MKKNFLIYTIIYTILLLAMKYLLNLFQLEFRLWIYQISLFLISLGLVIGIVQVIRRIKEKELKVFVTIDCIFLAIPICIVAYFLFFDLFIPEYVVIKNSEKRLAVVKDFYGVTVHYYEYKGPLIRGKNCILEGDAKDYEMIKRSKDEN